MSGMVENDGEIEQNWGGHYVWKENKFIQLTGTFIWNQIFQAQSILI